MSRSRWVAFPVVALLCAGSACSKSKPDSVTEQSASSTSTAVIPVESNVTASGTATVAAEKAPGERDVPTDLSGYLIWGEMGLPDGTTLERGPGDTCVARCGKAFVIEVSAADRPLAETKAGWATGTVRLLRDEPQTVFAELQAPGATTFAFETRIKLGEREYRLRNPSGATFTRSQAERMLQSATSLRETDATRAARRRDTDAVARLQRVGCKAADSDAGRELIVSGTAVTDDDLADVNDVAGLYSVAVSHAPRITARGLAHVTEARSVRALSLAGPDVTDELVTTLKPMSRLELLSLADHALSDPGLSFLAGCPGLNSISLAGSKRLPGVPRIKGDGFVHLARLTGLRSVTIRDEPMEDVGLEHLGAIRSIRELRLDGVRITDAGLRALDGLTALERLDLTRVPVRGDGLAALASLPSLRVLNLSRSNVTDYGLERLRGAHITALDLSYTGIGDRGVRALPEFPALTTVNLTGSKVSDAGLAHLGRVTALRAIALDFTGITGAGFSQLKAKPELRALSANHTAVTDAALGELPGCPGLETVRLDGTAVTDSGLERLQAVSALRTVSVVETDVTRSGVDRLKAALPRVVVQWDDPRPLPDPKPIVPPVGADQLPPADPASLVRKYAGTTRVDDDSPGKPVIALSLAGSAVTDAELAHLRDSKALQALDLTGCEKVTDAGLPYLAGLTELQELRLASTGVKGDGLSHLKGLTKLVRLELPAVPFTVRQIARLGEIKSLEFLRLSPIADAEGYLRFLAGFPRLKAIDLRGVRMTDRRMAYIGKMSSLERLDIESDAVGDRGLAQLKGLTQLAELRLRSNLATDSGLEHVGKVAGLKVLDLSGARFSDAGFRNLRGLTELERVRIADTALTDNGLSFFREFTKLIELDVRGANITDKGLAHLSELKDLESIDLSGTGVTDAGLAHFKGLEELRTLRIEDSRITGKGFAAIKRLPRLARLYLARSPVDDDGLAAIAQIEVLEQVELETPVITDAGLAKLNALPVLKQLTLVNTGRLTDKLIEILKSFPALAEVHLRGIPVSPRAIQDLKSKEGLTVHVE
ncbi:MAG TPA: hypothetical protein VKD90_15420 [Gemmataceae bacterium]|nr:hypothetical protein [Gemmataceae bacterium]